MTPAAELHAAAAKLRQRAEKVPLWARNEPWQVAQTDSENMDGVLIARDHQIGGEFEFAIEAHRESLADYIATVHPGVGLALADLLDRAAALPPYNRFRSVQDTAVEVARAILGDTDQPDAGRPA